MKNTKNSLIRSESAETLHKKLLKISLWDSLNKNRKEPMSFAFKMTPTTVLNRVLAVEYMTRHRAEH
ncbi:MAG: hypothetical protein JNJ69_04860 [Leptospiraceae bacterium]|nr:hypothetical protein [Leptospiraceae bacterium]